MENCVPHTCVICSNYKRSIHYQLPVRYGFAWKPIFNKFSFRFIEERNREWAQSELELLYKWRNHHLGSKRPQHNTLWSLYHENIWCTRAIFGVHPYWNLLQGEVCQRYLPQQKNAQATQFKTDCSPFFMSIGQVGRSCLIVTGRKKHCDSDYTPESENNNIVKLRFKKRPQQCFIKCKRCCL